MKTKLLILSLTAVLSAFISCKKDDGGGVELKTLTLSVVCGQKGQLLVSPSMDGCTFTSDQSLIASVSTKGEVKGITVGETTVSVLSLSNNVIGKCKVTVTPQYSMYREPYLRFSASSSLVKSYETRAVISETTKAINYNGENSNIKQLAYTFENGKYTGVVCLIPTAKLSLLTDFILERYVPVAVGSDDILAAFESVDKKTTVGIFYYSTSYVGSMYVPYIDGNKSKTTDLDSELIRYKELAIEILKDSE